LQLHFSTIQAFENGHSIVNLIPALILLPQGADFVGTKALALIP